MNESDTQAFIDTLNAHKPPNTTTTEDAERNRLIEGIRYFLRADSPAQATAAYNQFVAYEKTIYARQNLPSPYDAEADDTAGDTTSGGGSGWILALVAAGLVALVLGGSSSD